MGKEIGLDLRDEQFNSAVIELLIRNLAWQKSIGSLLADKFSNSEMPSDVVYKSLVDDCNREAQKILMNLYERRGHVDLNDLLGGETK
jgi:hypothetical protein